ncbi:MAG TPA: ABC transporter permease [Vicinamibacterales bacterium]|nr:ABC transporter permease [Vicinamibacterales bacterium]
MPLPFVRRDLGRATRRLRKTPGFTFIAVLSLALGIGGATAIFTVVNGVLLRPLPYADPDRLVVIGLPISVPPGTVVDWQEHARSFAAMGAAEYWTPNLAEGDRAEQIDALHVTPGIFRTLGVQPALGRTLEERDAHDGRDGVAVVADRFWRTRLHGRRDVIGHEIRLDGRRYTVVGVMPPSFRFAPFWATKAEVWAPAVLDARRDDREGSSMRVFARLAPGVSIGRARNELGALQRTLDASFSETSRRPELMPLRERVVGDVRRALTLLLAAVGLVLAIACSNVAHLQLVRGASRVRELALRSALGASRVRLVQHLVAESAAIAVAGGASGTLLAFAGVRLLLRLAPSSLPRLDSIAIDWRVLLFALACSAASALLFGVVPAWRSTAIDPAAALKGAPRGTTVGGARRARRALIVSEIAMAVVLLIVSGVLFQSFRMLTQVNPGLSPDHVLVAEVSLKGTADGAPGRRGPFFDDVLGLLAGRSGIEGASAINHLPLAGDAWRLGFTIEGRPRPAGQDPPRALYRVVMPGYFATMGIPVLRGRDFDRRDTMAAQHVVIVNDALARREWPGQDPIGRRLASDDRDPSKTDWFTVVAVVGNTVQQEWGAPVDEETFYPFAQSALYTTGTASYAASMTVVVRTSGAPEQAAPLLRRTVARLDPGVAVSHMSTMDAVIDGAFTGARFYVTLLSMFAAVATVLAIVGLHGVVADAAEARRHEFGVRLALGATRGRVLKDCVGEGLTLAGAGVLVALPAGMLAVRGLTPLLYDTAPVNATAFAAAVVLVMSVAAAAVWTPARRASAADPLAALRAD